MKILTGISYYQKNESKTMLKILNLPFVEIDENTFNIIKDSNRISKVIIMLQVILMYIAFNIIHKFYNGKVIIRTKKHLIFTFLIFEYTNKKYFRSLLYKLPSTIALVLLLLLMLVTLTNYLTHIYNVIVFLFITIQALYIPNSNI